MWLVLTRRLWLEGEVGDAGSLVRGLSTMLLEVLLLVEARLTASITPVPPLPDIFRAGSWTSLPRWKRPRRSSHCWFDMLLICGLVFFALVVFTQD